MSGRVVLGAALAGALVLGGAAVGTASAWAAPPGGTPEVRVVRGAEGVDGGAGSGAGVGAGAAATTERPCPGSDGSPADQSSSSPRA
jgi:hypothetical protein